MKLSKKLKREILENWFKAKMMPKYEAVIKVFDDKVSKDFEINHQYEIELAEKHKDLVERGFIRATNSLKVGGYYGLQCTDLGFSCTTKKHRVKTVKYAFKYDNHKCEGDVYEEAKQVLINYMEELKGAVQQVEQVLSIHNTDTSLLKDFPEFEKFIPKKQTGVEAGKNLISVDLVNSVKSLL